MLKTPRPHQVEAMQALRQSIGKGKRRPMLQAPTGSGKTVLAVMIIESALQKGNRVTFVVPALSLIEQTVKEFHTEGITNVGVIQGNHHMTNYGKPVQVCSIQTLGRRGAPDTDLVIIDEAHRDFKFTRDWMAKPEWAHVPFIGLSATPWTKGLGKHYDDLIIVQTTAGLIDKGILSPFRVFAAAHPDLTGVKTVAGDYHEGQLAEIMGEGALVSGVVSTWLSKGQNLPTLCFCVDRAHARKVHDEFNAFGVPCGYIDANTDIHDREAIRGKFTDGRLKIVANVGCLTTGVDWDVRCIILARPTKSEMLYVQIIGRGLRTAQGKSECLILDHSDTTARLGFVTDIHHDKLDDGKPKKAAEATKPEKLPKECKKCNYLRPAGVHRCPVCGFQPMKQSEIAEIDAELIDVTPREKIYTHDEKQAWYSSFLAIQREKNYSQGWVGHQFKEKFGVWPKGLHNMPCEPIDEVLNFVKAKAIRYAKQKEKEKRLTDPGRVYAAEY